MNVYTTDRIRNVVLLGHGGCGKTSLVEAMAYLAGMTSRMGKVEDEMCIRDSDNGDHQIYNWRQLKDSSHRKVH